MKLESINATSVTFSCSPCLKQVYRLLDVKSLRTTPYNPQTDGLTERVNPTLKKMLHKREWTSSTCLLNCFSEYKTLQVRLICNSDAFQENPRGTKKMLNMTLLLRKVLLWEDDDRIPTRLLKKEVDLMLSLGIMETSSKWHNPVVLVLKKVLHRLQVSEFNFCFYPTSRTDDLLEQLSIAKLLT